MSKILCDSDNHLFHKWSEWEVTTGIFSLGILFGRRAGERFERQVRARQCEWCKMTDWKDL